MKQYKGPAVPTPDDPPCDHWLPAFGCPPPKNASWIIGRFVSIRGIVEHRAHWADGGGEEQPRYLGWFYGDGDGRGFSQVDGALVDWHAEAGACARCGAALPSFPPAQKGNP